MLMPIHGDAAEAEFLAASLAFRQGDRDTAYGRFMSLANEGDGRAAGTALAIRSAPITASPSGG